MTDDGRAGVRAGAADWHAPQLRQNFSPAGFASPQVVQVNDCVLSDAPHLLQNVAPAGFTWPQTERRVVVFSMTRDCCRRCLGWLVDDNAFMVTPFFAPTRNLSAVFLYCLATLSAARSSAVRYALNSSSDWKWLVRPDTKCSTRPAAYASPPGTARNCTTNAHCGERGTSMVTGAGVVARSRLGVFIV
jgi:hypothetical protein